MASEPKKILIADDHTIFREGLILLIRQWEDFRVIGEVDNGKAALDFCRRDLPDVILMDVNMPVMGGVEATWHISKEFPSVVVVMLTMSGEDQNLFLAVKAGASGYVLKTDHAHWLHDTICRVINGEQVLNSRLAEKVLTEFQEMGSDQNKIPAPRERIEMLTERETEILELVATGLTNAEIGAKLYLSTETVKKYLSEVMHKLHLNNRVQVATYAFRKGLAK